MIAGAGLGVVLGRALVRARGPLQRSPVFQQLSAAVQALPTLQRTLGEITLRKVEGEVAQDVAHLRIEYAGTLCDAVVRTRARREGGQWAFQEVSLQLAGEGRAVDLLPHLSVRRAATAGPGPQSSA